MAGSEDSADLDSTVSFATTISVDVIFVIRCRSCNTCKYNVHHVTFGSKYQITFPSSVPTISCSARLASRSEVEAFEIEHYLASFSQRFDQGVKEVFSTWNIKMSILSPRDDDPDCAHYNEDGERKEGHSGDTRSRWSLGSEDRRDFQFHDTKEMSVADRRVSANGTFVSRCGFSIPLRIFVPSKGERGFIGLQTKRERRTALALRRIYKTTLEYTNMARYARNM